MYPSIPKICIFKHIPKGNYSSLSDGIVREIYCTIVEQLTYQIVDKKKVWEKASNFQGKMRLQPGSSDRM